MDEPKFEARIVDGAGREYMIVPTPKTIADQRRIAKAYGVPDHVLGIPTPLWRRLIQRMTRR